MKPQRGSGEIVYYVVVFVIAFIVIAFIGFIAFVGSFMCEARWKMSGMKASWGPIQGCVVQVSDGRWIPDDRVRDVDLKPRDAKE